MFENLPPLHRPTHDADTPRRRALNALGTVLGTLPPPWRVLRDASPSGEGAGLGVRFVALHPNFGIALVDLAPARPKAALAPLRSLLARGNGAIFTTREPPIASVLLARDEIPLAAARVEAMLAELPPSGIANPAWPEIAIALVTASYPHMMPTDGGRRAIAASSYASQPNAAQRAPEPPVEAPPPRQETRSAAASTPAAPAAPPAGSRESAAQAPGHAAEAPSTSPQAPEKAAARFGLGTPPIDVPRIEVPQFDPRRLDHGALEVPPASIETPIATGAPEAPQASADAVPPSEGEQPAETAPKPETVETPQSDGRQASRRKRAASSRNSRSRRTDPKPSFELPQIEIPRPELSGGGEAWMSRDRAAPGEPRLDVPRIDVPQPPPQEIPERGEASEAPPPRFDRSTEWNPASAGDDPASGPGRPGAAEPKPPHLRLVAERDPISPWPNDKRGTTGRKRARPVLWVVGGTLSAIIIAAVLAYPHHTGEPVGSTHLTEASPPTNGSASGSQQAAAASSPASEPAPQQADNRPAQAAPAPQPSPLSPPTETAEAKPVAPQQSEQSNPAAPPHAATILPPVATLPETLPEKTIAAARHAAPTPPQATREAAATPAPAPKPPAEAKAKPVHAPKFAKARRNAPEVTREAEAEITPKPAPAARRGVPPKASAPTIASAAIHPRDDTPQQTAPSAQSTNSDAATVMIDGTPYVAGREPHFLGSLAAPPAELASAPASVPANPPAESSPATSDSPPAGPLPPSTDFAITPHGIMTPSGVVTPFGK